MRRLNVVLALALLSVAEDGEGVGLPAALIAADKDVQATRDGQARRLIKRRASERVGRIRTRTDVGCKREETEMVGAMRVLTPPKRVRCHNLLRLMPFCHEFAVTPRRVPSS